MLLFLLIHRRKEWETITTRTQKKKCKRSGTVEVFLSSEGTGGQYRNTWDRCFTLEIYPIENN